MVIILYVKGFHSVMLLLGRRQKTETGTPLIGAGWGPEFYLWTQAFWIERSHELSFLSLYVVPNKMAVLFSFSLCSFPSIPQFLIFLSL